MANYFYTNRATTFAILKNSIVFETTTGKKKVYNNSIWQPILWSGNFIKIRHVPPSPTPQNDRATRARICYLRDCPWVSYSDPNQITAQVSRSPIRHSFPFERHTSHCCRGPHIQVFGDITSCRLANSYRRTDGSSNPRGKLGDPEHEGTSTLWNVKFTLEQTTKAQGGERYNSTLSLTSALDGSGWSTPRPGRYTPHCIGGWVGLRDGLDESGKSRPPPPGFEPILWNVPK